MEFLLVVSFIPLIILLEDSILNQNLGKGNVFFVKVAFSGCHRTLYSEPFK